MDFRQLKTLNIPEGVVIRIATPEGVVLWERGVQPDYPNIPNNEIWYTSTDGNIIEPYELPSDNTLISNTYENDIGKMVFEKELITTKSYMFANSYTLKTISLSNTIKTISIYTFRDCSNLMSVQLPKYLERLSIGSFSTCYNLENIVLPSTLVYIGMDTFETQTDSTFITSNSSRFVIENDCIVDLETKQLIQGLISRSDYRYNIPNSVSIISEGGFFCNRNLTEITIPSNIVEIKGSAFDFCSNLSLIISENKIAPYLISGVFRNDVGTNVSGSKVLRVPQGASGYETWLEQLGEGWTIEYITE